MVIDCRGQVSLYLGSISSNRKLGTILDIRLDQHHAVWFAETFGRTVPCILVHLHLLLAVTGLVDMAFQSRTLLSTGCCKPFRFQDVDDLGNRPLGNLLA